jgi:hypothetical protein
MAMRSRILLIGLCLAGTAAALAAAPKASVPAQSPKTVYLYTAAAVDQLRFTDPRHYAGVQRVLASADRLCKAGQPKLQSLQLDVQAFGCSSLVFTSYPPQRQISFRLDDTRFIAMVFLSDYRAKLVPGKLVPHGR